MHYNSAAFRNYDAWKTREPDLEPDDIPQPKCEYCGAFVKREIILSVVNDDIEVCDGKRDPEYGTICEEYRVIEGGNSNCPGVEHWIDRYGGTVLYHPKCKRCGKYPKEFI